MLKYIIVFGVVCKYGFSELRQWIFKCGNIDNTSLTARKKLKILMYRVSFFVIMYRRYQLLKMIHGLSGPY